MKQLSTFLKEFSDFLNKFQVVGLAIALVIGLSATQLVNSVVTDIISPLIGLATPDTIALESLSYTIGKSTFRYGHLISQGINFMIMALLIFISYKQLKRYRFIKDDIDIDDLRKLVKDKNFKTS